ncbi:hypothetical protein HUT06_35345 [Actinomadura sp. NAK00032]|uniref:hypothetical protein n=1 Tax=Actinomadura sp. NAK00032 TaxID=2742128 RepID=UPI0015926F61|nr:hypothetical protein [Actinomadura sp. NAK00032]QKW38645.1 hypothetical protein HUT06_35345 [Actinomadura sp. NAK00032]
MGLHPPAEPFHRPYAGPEPPSPARRPKRLIVLLVAAVAFAGAAVAVFLVVPGGKTERAAVTPSTAAPSPAETVPGVVRALPPACGTVAAQTVAKAVPKAAQRQSANSTLTTCTYTSKESAFRWLRVEARLYAPAHTATPVRDAESYYDAQWTQAHDAPLVRTIALEREQGVGDEAYRWFMADQGQPTLVGQVTARVRNAVVTVSYSEEAPRGGGQAARERAVLGTATGVAREVLTALNDF